MSINYSTLLLGTNLGNKLKNIEQAKQLITQKIGFIILESDIIESKPVGYKSDHYFLNQIIKIETILSPMMTLKTIKEIETKMGRIKDSSVEGYKDREIDIDILYFNQLQFNSNKLTIPHPQNTQERKFCIELIKSFNIKEKIW